MKRLKAWNESTEPTETLIGAANEIVLDGEWLKITPWGDFPNKVGVQRVTREDGEQMVAAFNSLRGKLSRGFRGLSVFVGHPDMDPATYQDRRRYGRINDLQAREDGLYGQVSWNSLGQAVIDDGQYLFNSPAWYLRREGRFVRPVQLLSVGLTNTPVIPGEPWAKNETQTQGNAMPKWLITLLANAGLMQPDGNEEAAQAAVNALLERPAEKPIATNEEITQARADLQAANERFTTERNARIDRELGLAVESGRITEAERTGWNERLGTDFDAGLQALQALNAKVPTKPHPGVTGAGQRKQEGAHGGDKIAAINEAVRKYAQEHGLNMASNDGYNLAFAAVKKAQPALFATS